jgi:hypothetical protein
MFELYGFTPRIHLAESPYCNYNCDCDAAYPAETLADMRRALAVRLGYAAMPTLPPGMAELLDSFLAEAQKLLYRRYKIWRLTRFFTWDMAKGERYYDLAANRDQCAVTLDPRHIQGVWVSENCDNWRPLIAGVDPRNYRDDVSGIPEFYEIRQCIEVWPAPSQTSYKLRIKGEFGLLPFKADDDTTTLDPEAIMLMALSNAKAHFGQPDANRYMSELQVLLGDLTAGLHQTRRYIPGVERPPNAVRPILKGGFDD